MHAIGYTLHWAACPQRRTKRDPNVITESEVCEAFGSAGRNDIALNCRDVDGGAIKGDLQVAILTA